MGGALPGHYEILEQIGAGGTAAVHRARDRRSGGLVALKILRGVSAVDARQLEREAAVLEHLHHDHVIRYLDHGRSGDGELYLAMPWIEGEPLAERLARQRLTIDEVMARARPLVVALEAAHGAGVIHRDLKPQNVLLAGG